MGAASTVMRIPHQARCDPRVPTSPKRRTVPGAARPLRISRVSRARSPAQSPTTAVTEVPKEALPPASLTVGAELVARGRGGETRLVRVKEIKEKTVIIDLNHPLAGKTLHFDVKVLGVEPPTKVEPPKQ